MYSIESRQKHTWVKEESAAAVAESIRCDALPQVAKLNASMLSRSFLIGLPPPPPFILPFIDDDEDDDLFASTNDVK